MTSPGTRSTDEIVYGTKERNLHTAVYKLGLTQKKYTSKTLFPLHTMTLSWLWMVSWRFFSF